MSWNLLAIWPHLILAADPGTGDSRFSWAGMSSEHYNKIIISPGLKQSGSVESTS